MHGSICLIILFGISHPYQEEDMDGSLGRGDELVFILFHDALFEFTSITPIAVGLGGARGDQS